MTEAQVRQKLAQYQARKIGSNGACAQYRAASGHVITVCKDGAGFKMQIPPGCGGCKKK